MSVQDQFYLRSALDSLAQDALDLSKYLAEANRQRQHLLIRRLRATQSYKGTKKEAKKAQIRDKMTSIDNAVRDIDRNITHARQKQIPKTRFYIHLKRLHGNLPYPELRKYESEAHKAEGLQRSHMALHRMLSLPTPTLLDDLAHHLLTTSLPFSQRSFLIMIRRLSDLRYGSLAKSAYLQSSVAGFAPDSSKAITLLLKLTVAIGDYREFRRLRRLLGQPGVRRDTYIYTALIVGCLKLGFPENARGYFRRMMNDGIHPPLQALTHMLHDCGSRRRWNLGNEVWRVIKDGQARAEFKVDALAYHTMLRLCRKCDQLAVARDILREASDDGENFQNIVRRPYKTYASPLRQSNKTPTISDLRAAHRANFKFLSGSQRGMIPQVKLDQFLSQISEYAIRKPTPPLRVLSDMTIRHFSKTGPKVVEIISRGSTSKKITRKEILAALKEATPEPSDLLPVNINGVQNIGASPLTKDEHILDAVQESIDSWLTKVTWDRHLPSVPPNPDDRQRLLTNAQRLKLLFSRKSGRNTIPLQTSLPANDPVPLLDEARAPSNRLVWHSPRQIFLTSRQRMQRRPNRVFLQSHRLTKRPPRRSISTRRR
jgi:pentatricopeptide repeat protein